MVVELIGVFMARLLKIDMTIRMNGDTWKIWNMGISKNGCTWCHIGSLTTSRNQRNGIVPLQRQTWVKGLPLEPEYIETNNN